ncbi:hypothetical protein C8Q70DRAFT_1027189 [Cubamyces menziesii]|uniref:Uncharacterized protein n=1 Tax=Trametes cubensis TaxID=1111947 RepID=A0AAD7U2G9_9APHY|nr:hypothetical protein C8Q70DRAFT_1027189 [Cubamyces menziesii]KAJ8496726.1 hypothetical protein ONZ51_g931 [Trametes cubensis]
MPPKGPLPDILVSGRPSRSNYRVLTPRTPHSRAGRAEEGFTEVELENFDDDEAKEYRTQRQQQSQPLLSPNSRGPGYRSRGDDHELRGKEGFFRPASIWGKLPLLGGSLLAVVILGLFAVSIQRPGTLEKILLQSPEEFSDPSEPYIPANDHTARPIYTNAPLPSPSIVETRPPSSLLISYENYSSFPLTGDEYRHECAKIMGGFMHHGEFWEESHMGSPDVIHHDDATNYHLPEGERTRVCSSTITYLLDGHVGLLADLGLMAQAAAFARERNRTFFVDDTHWTRGKWTDHFQSVHGLEPGPEPGCRPPPPEELVACPRTARHWVISSRTAKYHMGHSFSEEYEDPYGHQVNRLRPIYERARESFERVIRPNAHTAELIRNARKALADLLSLPAAPSHEAKSDRSEPASTDERAARGSSTDSTAEQQLYIAVHIRKGDRVPEGHMFYPDKQVPLKNYVDGARETWDRLYHNRSLDGLPNKSSGRLDHYPAPPIMWLASDSPAAAREFVSAFPPATAVFSLEHHIDSQLRALAPSTEYVQAEFDQEPLGERIRLTRGMIVDFAMLSGMWAWPGEIVPGAVVCGVGSNVCKLAALGFGFERAFGFDDDVDHLMGNINREKRRWVDVDVDGRIEPAWNAFELH